MLEERKAREEAEAALAVVMGEAEGFSTELLILHRQGLHQVGERERTSERGT